jgi:hypothetical protein
MSPRGIRRSFRKIVAICKDRSDAYIRPSRDVARALVATPAATGAGGERDVWRLANGAITDVRRELAAA